jgi:tetratricopeptide (TPR) repeat protein
LQLGRVLVSRVETTMRGRLLIVLLGLGVVLATWFVVRAVETRQFGNDLLRARRAFEAGRFDAARESLARLARRRPGEGEVEYLLGACEMVKGHADAAMEAWGRVPDASPLAPAAALARGRRALDIGRYRLAETCLDRASRGGGEAGHEAARLLEWLSWMTGRRDDYKKRLHQKAEQAIDPSPILRTLWAADFDPYPVDGMTQALAKAQQSAPDDDRIWLGLADLATRSGHYQEAGAWLDRCEQARPDDSSVWHARLRWAEAAGRPDEILRAASHLPGSSLSRTRVLALRAALAARNGDTPGERSALEALIAVQPGADAALERLADLAAQAGELDRVAELRRRKAEIDTARDHYRALINLPEMAPHAAEFARTAEAIGRWFDARVWWTLAVRRDRSFAAEASAAIARLSQAESAAESGARDANTTSPRSLTDLIAPIRPREAPSTASARGLDIPVFVDDAESRGLVFRFDNGCTDLRQIPETMSGGVALLDFDGDGWLDVYAVQGGPFPPPEANPPFSDHLFRNLGDGHFVDVTIASGLAGYRGGYGHGVAVGDYDNDGRPDLLVTRWRSYALYHNLGQGRFEDATSQAGLGGDRDWPTSAAWADLDNDGDLDLYVCHYLKWDAKNPELCDIPDHPGQGHTYCDPRGSPALPDHVFRNDGGKFVDVTEEAGIVDREGRGLGVVAADLDGDGRCDLFVANDTTANDFFHNLGGFRFTEKGMEAGLTASAEGGYLAGMGVACGDLDADGRLDLAVTNFFNQATTLYHNHGGGIFSDRSAATGLAAATRQVLGFGIAALDANNDGWLDLVQANGHVSDFRPTVPREMKAQLLLGDGAGRFVDVSDRAGPPWQIPRLARGLAVGDLDNDGRTDVVLVSQNALLALLQNRSQSPTHFLTLALEGTVSNRDAVAARVAVTASGRTQVAVRFGGGSYLSSGDPRLHFGLGPARIVDRVDVTWPSGRRDSFQSLAADTGYRLREGNTTPARLPGFGPVATDQ